MLKNIKIEFLNRWGIFKIAEYRYIINKKYGTAYQKATTSKSIIKEQHITAKSYSNSIRERSNKHFTVHSFLQLFL